MQAQLRRLSFWAMIAAMVLTAIGTANPVHGTWFELLGIGCIALTREAARRGH